MTNAKQRYAFFAIALSALFLFYKYILQISPSVMTDDLMRYFHVDGVGLGNLVATYFYTYLVTQLFVGPLLDKYSPKLLSTLAIALCASGAILFSSATQLGFATLGRGLVGVGAAFATVSYMKMAAVWFKPQQFAFVGGLLATAAMIGSMAGQAPMAWMVDQFGWHQSLFYCGLLGIVLTLVYFIFMRDNRTMMNSDGIKLKPQQLKWRDFAQVLALKENWLLMLYSGLAFSPVAVLGGLWGNPFLSEAYHLSRSNTASLMMLVFLGLAFGGPILGFISDHLRKRFQVMVTGLLLSMTALCLVLYLPMPTWLLAFFLFLFGFGTGAFMLGFALGKELNAIALAATVIGLINTGDALFGAFTEPLIGKLLDMQWTGKLVAGAHYFSVHEYHWALGLLPIYHVLALVFLLLLAKAKPRPCQR